jgi:hypothetical protein
MVISRCREDISRAVKRANLAKQNWGEGAKKSLDLYGKIKGPRCEAGTQGTQQRDRMPASRRRCNKIGVNRCANSGEKGAAAAT